MRYVQYNGQDKPCAGSVVPYRRQGVWEESIGGPRPSTMERGLGCLGIVPVMHHTASLPQGCRWRVVAWQEGSHPTRKMSKRSES